MKLTKAKLNRLVRKGIENLGYTYFKNNFYQGLYAKYLGDGFYLTIGLIIDRYYDDAFTAQMYLSNTTSIGESGVDFPISADTRPGFLLTKEELSIYYIAGSLNDIKGSPDIWWHSDPEGPNNIPNFLQTLEKAETRLLEKKELFESIRKSTFAYNLLKESEIVIDIFKRNKLNGEYKFIPKKEVNDIPMNWFKAAEEAICFLGEKPFVDWVKTSASNAYRMYELSKAHELKSTDQL